MRISAIAARSVLERSYPGRVSDKMVNDFLTACLNNDSAAAEAVRPEPAWDTRSGPHGPDARRISPPSRPLLMRAGYGDGGPISLMWPCICGDRDCWYEVKGTARKR